MGKEDFEEFQRKFKQNIFPPNWVTPKPTGTYDLIVIGGGPGGMLAAITARSMDARVALVEKEHLGGECLSYGCIPSKALLRSTRVIQEVRKAADYGLEIPKGWKVDFEAVMRKVHDLQTAISVHDNANIFKNMGIDIYFGTGHFTAPDKLMVGTETLAFKKAVIVTGTHPISLTAPGLEPSDYLTNQEIFNLSSLPPRLAVFGAGPIGCELSQAFLRLGSQVFLITNGTTLLPKDDRIAAERLKSIFEEEGIKILMRANLQRVEKRGKEKLLYFDLFKEPIAVDAILVAIGRKPVVDGLDLEKAGVSYDQKTGIASDDYLQTSNPQIYAAGDVTSSYKFTHMSQEMSKMAVANALNGNQRKKSALIIPWCTYTDPEVAHIGLSEEEARKKGISFESIVVEMEAVERAVLDRQTSGFIKLLAKENQIIGATIMAAHAGDMISELCVAMQSENGLSALLQAIHPFPTQSQILRTAAERLLKRRRELVSV